LFLFVFFLIACSARVETPQATGAASEADVVEVVEVVEEAGQEAQEALEGPQVASEALEVVPEPEAPVEASLAEQFVAAGGQKLCVAMVEALNPEWRLDACRTIADEDRRKDCEARRQPLHDFAGKICDVVIEEAVRHDFDPVMVLSVIERESSFGRTQLDRSTGSYKVETDICRTTLSKSRIVDRRPGKREGTELLTWTYGPSAPQPGALARNRQPVRVIGEDDETIVVDTCIIGETGIMQTSPREYRRGTVIEATGETLEGSEAQRRAQLLADPALQVRVGCLALDEHRALCPEAARGDWTTWLPAYNLGQCSPTWEKWNEYLGKVMKHYLDACDGWLPGESGLPTLARDLWPECARIAALRDSLRGEE
jgi:hypothetical protein